MSNSLPKPTTPRYSSPALLFAEIAFIVGATWWPEDGPAPVWSVILYALLFGVGTYHLSQNRTWIAIFLPIVVVSIATNYTGESTPAIVIRVISLIAVHAILLAVILHHSFIRENVPKIDRLLAGIAGNLLLGLFWMTMFLTLRSLGYEPLTNLTSGTSGTSATQHETLYYSFITLTAVGYGEIVPAVPIARTFAIFASLSGILYLGVFISSLRENAPSRSSPVRWSSPISKTPSSPRTARRRFPTTASSSFQSV